MSHQVIAGVTLVGDASPPDQRDVGRGLPAVLDLWQIWARVIPGHLCGKRREEKKSSKQRWRCFEAFIRLLFAVAARVPGGSIATSHLDVTPPHILARTSPSQGD